MLEHTEITEDHHDMTADTVTETTGQDCAETVQSTDLRTVQMSRVKGTKRERDYAICLDLAAGIRGTRVAEAYGIDTARVSRIKKRNIKLINELTLSSGLATVPERIRELYYQYQRIRGRDLRRTRDPLDILRQISDEMSRHGISVPDALQSGGNAAGPTYNVTVINFAGTDSASVDTGTLDGTRLAGREVIDALPETAETVQETEPVTPVTVDLHRFDAE